MTRPAARRRHLNRLRQELTKTMTDKQLEHRLDELEMRVAFQDDVINTLSEQVATQELELRQLWEAKQLLHRQLKEVSGSNIRSDEEEAPPPHY